MSQALVAGQQFIDALDSNDYSEIIGTVDLGGTWWVDTGLDRAAGVHGFDKAMAFAWANEHAGKNIVAKEYSTSISG